MSRADELAIICSNTPGWELTPYREAVKIIEDLDAECAEWGKRAKSAGEYLERKVSQLKRERDEAIEALKSVDYIMWMAENYAESGGSRSIEMEDYTAAKRDLDAALEKFSGPERDNQ